MNVDVEEVGAGRHMLLEPKEPSGRGDVIASFDYQLKSNDADESEPKFATKQNGKQGNEAFASYVTESNSRKGSSESGDDSTGSKE